MNSIYIIYSVEKELLGEALYPDDPKVIECVAKNYIIANEIVEELEKKDNTRLYGYECWEVFDYIPF